MDGTNPSFLCVALLGAQNRVVLQLTDSTSPDEPARLYVHSQVNHTETIAMLSTLLFHLANCLENQPDYFERVPLPTDTRSIFRHF